MRRNPGLVALLALGLALRGWTMVAYRPAVLGYPDGTEYLVNGVQNLWRGIGRPVGYPILIRGIATLGGGLTALVSVQHLLGLATAVALYWIVRMGGAPRAFACVPAAVVVLSGDQLYVEHSPLSEPLFAFILVLAVAFALRGATGSPGRAVAWSAAVGAAAGAASVVRYVGEPLVVVFALWALLYMPRARLACAAVVCAVAVAVVGVYVGARAVGLRPHGGARGQTGLAIPGNSLYGRVAPFADCSRFTPPAGTAPLCDGDPSRAEGPGWYAYVAGSPILSAPPAAVQGADRWARAALLHQPLDYLAAVARDFARYVFPTLLKPPGIGWGDTASGYRVGHPRGEEAHALDVASDLFGPTTIRRTGIAALDRYQAIVRVHGAILGAFLLLALLGLLAGGEKIRAGRREDGRAAWPGDSAAGGTATRRRDAANGRIDAPAGGDAATARWDAAPGGAGAARGDEPVDDDGAADDGGFASQRIATLAPAGAPAAPDHARPATAAPPRVSLRGAILLPAAVAVVALVVPVMTAVYDARYTFPVEGLLAAAGALGAWAVVRRRL